MGNRAEEVNGVFAVGVPAILAKILEESFNRKGLVGRFGKAGAEEKLLRDGFKDASHRHVEFCKKSHAPNVQVDQVGFATTVGESLEIDEVADNRAKCWCQPSQA